MPALVRITPWPDPVLDALGHDPRSWYAETFWLPTLGPTALLLLRHLADRFDEHPQGLTLPVADTAAALGLGPRDGEQSPLVRSLHRLQQFDLAHAHDPQVIAVRRTLPPIHRRHVRRLPVAIQARHASGSRARRRARGWTRPAVAPGASRSRFSWKVNRATPSSARSTAPASTRHSVTTRCDGPTTATRTIVRRPSNVTGAPASA